MRMIPTLSTLVWLASALALAACGSLPPDVAKARSLFEQRDYLNAHLAAREALVPPPGHPEAWRIDIHSLLSLGRADQAMADYRQWYSVLHDHDRTLLPRLALTTLWQGLRVPSAQVQVRAIQVIERRELEKLAQDVETRMGDESDPVAAAAAVAVLRSRPGAPVIATQLLASDNALARAIAVEGIGRKVGKSARPDLLFALRDPDARVRQAGVQAIAAMKQPEDTALLGQLATEDPAPDVRVAALDGLAKGKRKGAAVFAVRALEQEQEQPAVRLAGLRLLAKLSNRDQLQRIASDPTLLQTAPWLALCAHLELARLAKTTVDGQALWRRALTHDSWVKSWETRAAAARALVPGGRRTVTADSAKELLQPLIQDQDSHVRLAAALALAHLGNQQGSSLLSSLCHDPDPLVREAAVRAHGEIQLLSIGLVETLADPSALLRIQAADTILSVLH